jgi:hypothetical protein
MYITLQGNEKYKQNFSQTIIRRVLSRDVGVEESKILKLTYKRYVEFIDFIQLDSSGTSGMPWRT